MRTETERIRIASSRHATAVRLYGKDDPRTVQARRELAAAKVHATHEAARAAGLDEDDITAVQQTGALRRATVEQAIADAKAGQPWRERARPA